MVQFSFFNVPFERRMQTFAVSFIMLLPLVLIAFDVGSVFFPFLYPLMVPVLIWTFVIDRKTPRRGGRPWQFLRRSPLWRWFVAYFPLRLVVEEKLERGKPHILAISPHGIISLGVWGNIVSAETGAREKLGLGEDQPLVATVSSNFLVPIWRDLLLGLGFMCASRSAFHHVLSRGGSVAVVVGGAAEALYSTPGVNDLVLRRRTGFVRLALLNGAALVPVFSFGETDLYYQKIFAPGSTGRVWQDRLKRLMRFSMPLIRGRGFFNYSFGVLPQRRVVTTVVGRPIPVEKVAEPTEEQVQALLTRYIAELEALFERHRADHEAAGGLPSTLRIVE